MTTTDACADDVVSPPHRSTAAYRAGVALTFTGAAFLIAAIPAAAGTMLALAPSQPVGGPAPLGAAAIGGVVLAGCTVLGLSTLIPGLVLMSHDKAVPTRSNDLLRDAHATPPLPGFTWVPIVSSAF